MDDTRHYLVCPRLWPLICSVMQLPLNEARHMFGRDVFLKLSLNAPSKFKIQAIGLAYRAYHYIKHNHLEQLRSLKRNRDLHAIIDILLDVLNAIWRHNRC